MTGFQRLELWAMMKGRKALLSKELGLSRPSVHNWFKRREVPPDRCLGVERVTGISRYELRPDVFGTPDHA